uniref:Sulfotransferase n=1 Tax=Laticauda laticaudata TaxID=8630 RepID=A0A8C5RLI3_LATLA
ITYPKSGTIWTQNIVSLILHEGHRDGTENITLIDRTPWLECNIFHIDFSTRPSPCLFTSHLPYYLVPKALQNKTGKIIYVFRNPKDVLVSTYHFTKITPVRETPKDFDTFLEWFLSSKVPSSLWLDHVEGWYTHKGDFNILFLSYGKSMHLIMMKQIGAPNPSYRDNIKNDMVAYIHLLREEFCQDAAILSSFFCFSLFGSLGQFELILYTFANIRLTPVGSFLLPTLKCSHDFKFSSLATIYFVPSVGCSYYITHLQVLPFSFLYKKGREY